MERRTDRAGIPPWKWLLGPWMATVICLAYLWAQPLESFQQPEAARIIFWHVPMAMLGLGWFWAGAYHALRFLFGPEQGSLSRDMRICLCCQVGLLCTVLATATGSVFAAVQWGTPWNWDPKEVSITVLILIYLAYFALRASVENPDLRGRTSAVYAIIGAIATPFLMYVIPQLPQIKMFHPDNVIVGGLDTKWKIIYWMSTLGFAGITYWVYQLRLRLAQLEEREEPPSEEQAVRLSPVRGPVLRG